MLTVDAAHICLFPKTKMDVEGYDVMALEGYDVMALEGFDVMALEGDGVMALEGYDVISLEGYDVMDVRGYDVIQDFLTKTRNVKAGRSDVWKSVCVCVCVCDQQKSLCLKSQLERANTC